MPAGVQPSDVTATWKERYGDQLPEFLGYEDQPAIATIRKSHDLGGIDEKIPAIVTRPQGLSGKFDRAQFNQTPGVQVSFAITPAETFGLTTIDGQTLARSKGKENAFLDTKTLEVDGIWQEMGRYNNIHIFRDGTGVIGCLDPTVNVNSAGTYLLGSCVGTTANINTAPTTVCSPYDSVNFEQGMAVNCVYWNAAISAYSYRNPGGSTAAVAYVLNPDTGANTLTFTASPTGTVAAALSTLIPAAAAGDMLVRDGDLYSVIQGFLSWNPIANPGSTDNFFGLNRSNYNSNRIAGQRYIGINSSPVDVVMTMCALAKNQGAVLDTIWMNYRQTLAFMQGLEAKKTYDKETVRVGSRDRNNNPIAEVSFSGIDVNIPGGVVTIMTDNCCPDQLFFGQEFKWWELASVGDFPMMLDEDSLSNVRLPNANAYEWRFGGYPQLICRNTSRQIVAQVAST